MRENILACIDSSAYAALVCDLAAWASRRMELPVELLHVVQRKSAVAERHDLSGAIGLGVKTKLLEELTQIEEADARLQVERGRVLITSGKNRLEAAGVLEVKALHRHGGIVETILEREADARILVMGKRGASHEFAQGHIGSKVERVVRASSKPILIASRNAEPPQAVVLAYDGGSASGRALELCASSPLLSDMPVHVVVVGNEDDRRRQLVENAHARLNGRNVATTLKSGKPEDVIAAVVGATPGAVLMMGAYGHSPLRTLIVGSTTTAMIRTVHAPILLVR